MAAVAPWFREDRREEKEEKRLEPQEQEGKRSGESDHTWQSLKKRLHTERESERRRKRKEEKGSESRFDLCPPERTASRGFHIEHERTGMGVDG